MTDLVPGEGFRLRRAGAEDVDYLVALGSREEVEPFLAAVSPWAEEDVRAAIDRGREAPRDGARYVLELADADSWIRAGGLAFAVQNRRSRIAYVFGVMLDPSARGRGLATGAVRTLALHLIRELGYHRVQLEVYGYNERALGVFERAGFVREGVRRKAYWRNGEWHDGVQFGLVEEDLDA